MATRYYPPSRPARRSAGTMRPPPQPRSPSLRVVLRPACPPIPAGKIYPSAQAVERQFDVQ